MYLTSQSLFVLSAVPYGPLRRLKEEDLTKHRHRLKKRRFTSIDIEASRRIWKTPVAPLAEDQLTGSNGFPFSGESPDTGRVSGKVINGSNSLSIHLLNGVHLGRNGYSSHGRRSQKMATLSTGGSEPMVAGVCRSEEGRIKLFLKVSSSQEANKNAR
jgi:hypothetical protein